MAFTFVTKIVSLTTSHLPLAAAMVVTMRRLRVRWLPPKLAIGYSELHLAALFSHRPKQTRLLRVGACRRAAHYTLVT